MKADHVEKLSKKTIALIAFLSGIGILCVGACIGYAVHPVSIWMIRHAQLVVKASLASCVFPLVWLLGQPVKRLLNRR